MKKYLSIHGILIVLLLAFTMAVWYGLLSLVLVIPLLLVLGVALLDLSQKKHAVRRNFPVIGNFRYIFEAIRPEIMQYFIESDIDGAPINRMFRSLVYQRAKNQLDTSPFGTKMDVYKIGYEWMNHVTFSSLAEPSLVPPTVCVGGRDCLQPYLSSLLNISAMSFGALSKNAVLAMNKGAKLGSFAQNTGEGGISDYHLEHGGDLIWQIGTGYFGCRKKDGSFCETTFRSSALLPAVKMIEIKLSQGAKPGHGGMLPALKNTPEVARYRHVEPFKAIHSPAFHSEFADAAGLLYFVQRLRRLSDGKPVGFKFCVSGEADVRLLCEEMIRTGIYQDFITVDGGEGGTGAAPVEFSNSLGMPLRDGLALVNDLLEAYGIRKEIRLMASGKLITGFHMARILALGADVCYAARAMMLATGCIQALRCNTNSCPVGVATQQERLVNGLDVADKSVRVATFHEKTLQSLLDLTAAAGLQSPMDIERRHIHRRISTTQVKTYAQIYIAPAVQMPERKPLIGG
ncbi:Glutamate synthase domain-containing protein 2 [Cyclobacterium xiamenense]|uniref:Glutamate synthase domain-containing protein 2 n=2 Tax=Cyclobacterium xiamenense TaxID=1297121 RepID=A0A1H6WEX8_9BACT|nr:Glutamate synthase domain-containing protein 2 [Cyclobacterium xiamenense]